MLQTEHTLQSFATDIEQCTLHSALHTVEMLQTEHTSPSLELNCQPWSKSGEKCGRYAHSLTQVSYLGHLNLFQVILDLQELE